MIEHDELSHPVEAGYRTVTTRNGVRPDAEVLGGVMDMRGMQDGRRVSEDERAYLMLPRPALSGCIALGVVRDTRGVAMSDAQRFSHFPRSPYCGISWVQEGEVFEVRRGKGEVAAERMERLSELCVSGPRLQPTTMWSPGEAYGVTVVFYPDAWQALTGVELDAIQGRNLPVDGVLESDLCGFLREAAAQDTAKAGFALLQDYLEPIWRAQRSEERVTPFWFQDWTTALAVRAATSGAGRSARQFQRRIKNWAGLSQRDLDQQARVEKLFARSVDTGASDLAGLAQEFGFADQAHMGRHVRKITGAPPAKINELIETQESYWIYRLMGERLTEKE